MKWKNRTEFKDKSSKPKNIKYALTQLQMRVALTIRYLTWMPLDEVAEAMNPKEPEKTRSAIYRTFLRHRVNKVPQKIKEKVKKFKEYAPGYLHIDVTYLPKIEEKKYYLFVAIDRATRSLYYKIYNAKTSTNAEHFMLQCLNFFPFGITHVLTDNGLEFTNKLIKNKKGAFCTKPSKLDLACEKEGIDKARNPKN